MDKTVELSTDDIVFRDDLYPRFDPNPSKIQDYADNLDRLPPIEVNQRRELIDGYHRWTAHKKMGVKSIAAIITETRNDFEFERLAYMRNSAHGLQLTTDEKKAYALRQYTGDNEQEIADVLSISARTVKRYVAKKDQALREERDRTIRNMWLACETMDDIAGAVGASTQTVHAATKEFLILDNWQKSKIHATHQDPDFTPPLYDVWSFGSSSNSTKHFGNSEVRIVDRLLYLYTDPFDIVLDPFGGGGSTIDICKHRLRRYWVSDRLPIEERAHDIRQHDILEGPPPLHKRWGDVSLLYLDPPYWRQAAGEYSDDPQDLANMPLEDFYTVLTEFVEDTASRMRTGATVALLIQPTQWRADDRHYPADHVMDLVMRMGGNLRYRRRIACPYQTEQYNPQQVNWAKENLEVLTLTRELIIWTVENG